MKPHDGRFIAWLHGAESLSNLHRRANCGDRHSPKLKLNRSPPQQQIERLLSAADNAWGLVLSTPLPVLRIGRDALALTLTSDRDGRFAIYYLGSDGRALTRLYPTRVGEANQLRAGVPFTIPRRWRSQGPAGNNRLVAVAVQEGGDELAVLANLSDTPPSSYAAATLDVAEAP